ncbi:uncharacterized protein SPPG_08512 [Spizellomyces punctatus DAOM BR117]|uniref:Flavin-containing monooxygenase 5 n=1 Tax=Spizellomyces punctatus (strain DAOM BR117) TaxID=645134 RepID=A0A0L0H589_SPIPD|nr:uncharacterized protein SPPG_08512 [Spizellomyces punctatus DAOM BR117]KNC96124.1 hypothetical protein SPPG_08512 [Spizellomyces punctatus DAOM BR117]|eukprot:XP_016604164.1 hypothetical protein SPPG_08512 [Spizellomyces punctatus DAOM BR117]
MSKPRVAVIGAGASGLAALKQCLEEKLDVVCFDQEPQVGGLWRYVPHGGDETHSSVYMSTIINTSKEMMSFSDFPAPKDWPTFLPHRFVVKYLNLYCDHFDLRKHIKFNRKVISLSPEIGPEGSHTGRWEVVTQKVRRKQPAAAIPQNPRRTARSPAPCPPPTGTVVPPAVDGRRALSPVRGRSPAPSSDSLAAPQPSPRGRSRMYSPIREYDPSVGYEPVDRSASVSPREPGVLSPPSSPSGSDHSSLRPFSPTRRKRRGKTRSRSHQPAKSKCETFDYVIVATGHHWKPRLPDFEGVDTFKGSMMHSHSYKVPYPFKDQRVLIIGIGNSGADIATELSHHAKQVILSARSGTWILPRFSLFGIPLDHLSSRIAHALPRPLTNFAFETAMRLQNGDLGRYGLKPDHHIFEAHPTINGHVLDRIASGKVLVRPNIAKFTEGNKVEFEDGTSETIDTVVYCTGYRIEHPFLDNALAILGQERTDSNRVRLYKNVFPIRHRNLAFVGLVQPIGAVMPVSEMQARWVSRVFAGHCKLPDSKSLRDAVDLEWQEHTKRFVPKERHTVEVEYVTYMDDLADLIGCKPDAWKLFKARDVILAAQIMFGPAVPTQYRLLGPGSWEGARQAIADACEGFDFRKVVGYKAVEKLREEGGKENEKSGGSTKENGNGKGADSPVV